jgi:ubiquinone/menaquinone biosynthesis C-methylase UbiE
MGVIRVALQEIARTFDRLSMLFVYLAAATMPLQHLRAAQAEYWSDFALSDDDIDRGAFTWERDVMARWVRPGMRVLLVGCGSGRDLIQLLRHGCRVTGVDMAEGPLRRAREKLDERGLDARLIHGWIEDLPLDETFDVVWFSWLSYGYIPMAVRRVAMLRRLSAYLRPGGVAVVNVLRDPPQTRAIAAARWVARLCGSRWLPERGDTLMKIPGVDGYHYAHLFEAGEAERELADAGLTAITGLHDGTVLVAASPAASAALAAGRTAAELDRA